MGSCRRSLGAVGWWDASLAAVLPLCVRDKGPILQSLCSNSLDWAHQKWQHALCGDCMTGGLKNPGFTLNHSSVMQRNTLPTHIQSNSSIFTSLLLWFSPLKTKQIKEPHYLLKTNIMGICTVESRGKLFCKKQTCIWKFTSMWLAATVLAPVPALPCLALLSTCITMLCSCNPRMLF